METTGASSSRGKGSEGSDPLSPTLGWRRRQKYTCYLIEHPGVREIGLEHTCADATESSEDVGHSHDMMEMLKQ
ncbi:Cytochrome b5 type B [Cricetulus griseus]|uniref:Cytochrome b5 type B n=1 Tax=Cricetulus griseus TaxID=10029 RepID=G3H9Y4_CRIGR|nr:Cytochrome b5 type B [Cricetulus griseus]